MVVTDEVGVWSTLMSEKVIDRVKLHEGFRSTADLFTSNFHSIAYA